LADCAHFPAPRRRTRREGGSVTGGFLHALAANAEPLILPALAVLGLLAAGLAQ
jgi:hypothetical protein